MFETRVEVATKLLASRSCIAPGGRKRISASTSLAHTKFVLPHSGRNLAMTTKIELQY